MRAVDHLRRLIAFPTVSNRPVAALSAYTATVLEDLGFSVRLHETGEVGKHNLVARIGAGPPGEGLILSGHMDVVPVDGQPWTSDPFVLTERGDRLVGRGTADMKGFLAATLDAVARIDGLAEGRPLVLVWTCDEEIGCLGSAVLVDQLAAASEALPRAAVIGEPTSFRMLRMHPGHVATELEFGGVAAHSSRPDLGHNAIEDAARAVLAISAVVRELMEERRFEDLLERPWVAVNTAEIAGGTAINIVPDRCVVRLGYRPLPGTDPLDVHRRIVARLHELGLHERLRARVLRVTPAMLTEARSATWELLAPHAVHEHEEAATFATDGGNLAKLGIEPLVFGPGAIEVAHQADEFVPRADLHRAADVVEAIVRTQCLPT